MKLILDAFGGDNAPKAVVEGAIDALNKHSDLVLALVGKEDEIRTLVADSPVKERIEIVNATEIITNDDVPTNAIRQKKDSSIVVGLNKLKSEDYEGFISAGSTGALLTGSFMLVGRIKGISRPALAPIFPTVNNGNVMLIDCGANTDCKAVNLVDFAKMGNAYMQAVHKVSKPRIALLSNGTEEHKGNLLNSEVYPLLKDSNMNFVGNIEARDILSGDVDVVVSDGFSGNIALKSLEGMAGSIFYLLKQSIKEGGLKAKLGALLLKDSLRSLKHKMDYNRVGGAAFLGVEKLVVKAHGASQSVAIVAAIEQAIKAAEGNLIGKIKESLV